MRMLTICRCAAYGYVTPILLSFIFSEDPKKGCSGSRNWPEKIHTEWTRRGFTSLTYGGHLPQGGRVLKRLAFSCYDLSFDNKYFIASEKSFSKLSSVDLSMALLLMRYFPLIKNAGTKRTPSCLDNNSC